MLNLEYFIFKTFDSFAEGRLKGWGYGYAIFKKEEGILKRVESVGEMPLNADEVIAFCRVNKIRSLFTLNIPEQGYGALFPRVGEDDSLGFETFSVLEHVDINYFNSEGLEVKVLED